MKRSEFLQGVGLASAALVVAPNVIFGQDDIPTAYDRAVVQEFVDASHGRLSKVKELLAEYPNLVRCTHDWGGGDFETGIGAGGHVGNVEVVNYLIEKGAVPSLHVLTMLGKTELVKSMIEAYPLLLNSNGPHGLTLLYHADKGGDRSKELMAYFEEKGLKEMKAKIY